MKSIITIITFFVFITVPGHAEPEWRELQTAQVKNCTLELTSFIQGRNATNKNQCREAKILFGTENRNPIIIVTIYTPHFQIDYNGYIIQHEEMMAGNAMFFLVALNAIFINTEQASRGFGFCQLHQFNGRIKFVRCNGYGNHPPHSPFFVSAFTAEVEGDAVQIERGKAAAVGVINPSE